MTDFQKKVVYEIYPKSFYDTTGNGTGDLKGVIAKIGLFTKTRCRLYLANSILLITTK